MKKTQPDDVMLVLSAAGAASIDTHLGRRKERRLSVRKLLDAADIHVLDPLSGSALYRWKHLFWRKDPTPETELLLELLGRIEVKDLLFARLGHDVEDIEVWGGYVKNPFRASVVREMTMTV